MTHVGVGLAFAFVVAGMIFAVGHVSGAHINPAVTIAFWIVGRFPGKDVLPYIAAQLIGAVAAAVVMGVVVGPSVAAGATVPSVTWSSALLVEFWLSFALMFVIMAVATDERVADGFAALAVGLTVGFCALAAGPLTGASMNPGRSFGPALAAGQWAFHWIYWVAPVVGAAAAAFTYEFVRAASTPDSKPVRAGIQGAVPD